MATRKPTVIQGKKVMLKLYNTLSRKKEPFKPLDDKKVKMFTCGPSIYRRPHVGNYRTFLWEDVLQRYLEYTGHEVSRVLNFTDVEDKAIAEAEREDQTVSDLTEHVAAQFFRDTALLRIKRPDHLPRSSTSVDQAARLIKILIEKDVAYWYGKDVFFDPLKYKGFGRLFGLDMSRWPKEKRRFRKDTYPGSRWNLGDFILWHGYKDGDKVFWDTEIGRGRPSWNIQDPAMITKHLGYRIDIACGGSDNLFRHHDYNLAVIEAASGEEFARYWVHGEHLLVNGKKMSKSLGNIIYPEDLIRGEYTADHVRFYLLDGQHGKKLNLTSKNFQKTCARLDALRSAVAEVAPATPTGLTDNSPAPAAQSKEAGRLIKGLTSGFAESMDNDLDIGGAVDHLLDTLSRLGDLKGNDELGAGDFSAIDQGLHKIDAVLQFIFP